MHGRKPYDPKRVEGGIEIIPFSPFNKTRGRGGFAHAVKGAGALSVVSLVELQKARGMLAGMGIEVHQKSIRPGRSFSFDGRKRLLEASGILQRNVLNGIPTVLTCRRGDRRSGRVLYLVHRYFGATHEEAMEHSDAPPEDEERLREMYEKEAKEFH
jgi:hypothetical protein